MVTMVMKNPNLHPPSDREIRGLIFDCDGTLADTMPLHWRAWQAIAKRHQLHFPEDRFYSLGGVPSRDILKMLGEEQGVTLDHLAVAHEKEAEFQPLISQVEPINTVVEAVQKARVAAGETVMIAGCGPIGLQLLMVSKLQGAKLYTSDPIPERRAKSLTLGALEAFDPTNGKLIADLKARTEGRGADAVLVAVAHPAVVLDALAAARPGGRVLLFAANDPVTKIEFPAAAVGIDEKEILGSYSAAVDIQDAAADLVLQRKLPVMEIVTHRFPLDRIQEALELAAQPTAESLKILIKHA